MLNKQIIKRKFLLSQLFLSSSSLQQISSQELKIPPLVSHVALV